MNADRVNTPRIITALTQIEFWVLQDLGDSFEFDGQMDYPSDFAYKLYYWCKAQGQIDHLVMCILEYWKGEGFDEEEWSSYIQP